MYVKDYKYLIPTIDKEDHFEIEGLSRDCSHTDWFINKVKAPGLNVRTAVLYAGGFNISQSVTTDVTSVNNLFRGNVPYSQSKMAIKEGTAYSLHKWIGEMAHNQLVVYTNINSNTCASSMHSIYEAERILKDDIADEVIVIAEERTSFNTIRIFKEHRIPLVCGDGFAMVKFTKDKTDIEVTDTKWEYEYNSNPFATTQNGYYKIDTSKDVKYVKLHGTGTPTNTEAEKILVHGNREPIMYKPMIGHTQGASALLELCMLIDDKSIDGLTLCSAAGLGGFYGSCIVNKEV